MDDISCHENIDWYSVCIASGNDIGKVCLRCIISWIYYSLINVYYVYSPTIQNTISQAIPFSKVNHGFA